LIDTVAAMSDHLPTSSQAEAMIRRVSPEGRARAQREQQRRQRATARLAIRCAIAALVIAGVTAATNRAIGPMGLDGLFAAVMSWVIACVAIGIATRERPPRAEDLSQAELARLPERAGAWLELQRPALPAPAVQLLDGIEARLSAMAPQLAGLDARGPAADAVRRLLATELPDLVEGYKCVPPTQRAQQRDDGRSPDTHLLHGLALIDAEIDRMTGQLGRGAFDELATQSRFLELKYEGDASFT